MADELVVELRKMNVRLADLADVVRTLIQVQARAANIPVEWTDPSVPGAPVQLVGEVLAPVSVSVPASAGAPVPPPVPVLLSVAPEQRAVNPLEQVVR